MKVPHVLAAVLAVAAAAAPETGGLPPFHGGLPITDPSTTVATTRSVPYIAPKEIWTPFTILIWQYRTRVEQELELYRAAGFRGFHIDRGHGQESRVAFASKHGLPYYVDHAADKGYLHLTDRHGRQDVLRKSQVIPRPNSLADREVVEKLKGFLDKNVAATKNGPVVAYAFDDEISLGSFNSPAEVDGSPASVAWYRRWLRERYGTIEALNESWNAAHASFEEAEPVSFEDVRRPHRSAPFAEWNLAPWIDWRSFMDTQLAEVLRELTLHANRLDGKTPAGFVGGQQPSAYGGYDYTKLAKSVQWIEAYDIGATGEILRSFWLHPERRPYVQTWFSTGNAKRDSWFLWYYLLHGNRGVIAWPDREGSWFEHEGRGLRPFIRDNVQTFQEIQSDLSRAILDPDVRFDADPIAVFYSHPSIQISWAMDSVTHGRSWPNRSSSLDNANQTAGKNREAWLKILEDLGYQYNVLSGEQVAAGSLIEQGYRVLILNRAIALSDGEAAAIRRFVSAGGTVIADHLTGLFNEHGTGRERGALDDLFGISRDEAKGYLDGRMITEIDGELYQRPFLKRFRAYEKSLRHEGVVVYERGTKASGGRARATVDGAAVLVAKRTGKGRTLYLNLTPTAYFATSERLGPFGATWRELVGAELRKAGLQPRALAYADGERIDLAELVYWTRDDRTVVGLVKNPTRQGSVSGVGEIAGVSGQELAIEIRFASKVTAVKNLRTGEDLPEGNVIRAKWKPWEGLMFELTLE